MGVFQVKDLSFGQGANPLRKAIMHGFEEYFDGQLPEAVTAFLQSPGFLGLSDSSGRAGLPKAVLDGEPGEGYIQEFDTWIQALEISNALALGFGHVEARLNLTPLSRPQNGNFKILFSPPH